MLVIKFNKVTISYKKIKLNNFYISDKPYLNNSFSYKFINYYFIKIKLNNYYVTHKI